MQRIEKYIKKHLQYKYKIIQIFFYLCNSNKYNNITIYKIIRLIKKYIPIIFIYFHCNNINVKLISYNYNNIIYYTFIKYIKTNLKTVEKNKEYTILLCNVNNDIIKTKYVCNELLYMFIYYLVINNSKID